jgi:hypothetical protein
MLKKDIDTANRNRIDILRLEDEQFTINLWPLAILKYLNDLNKKSYIVINIVFYSLNQIISLFDLNFTLHLKNLAIFYIIRT